ncbi:MAG TPA: hypothetical protein VNT79_06230 [Phycisphaerae bacterium]|nr:hypothetical protein [Phycisphaerae bacterium]
MKTQKWRAYPVHTYHIDRLVLGDDGGVDVAGRRFRNLDEINVVFQGGNRAIRAAGPGQFLIVQRVNGVTLFFKFHAGTWERWVRLYRVGRWRYLFHDVVRSWGFGAPFLLASVGAVVWTVIRATYLCFQPQTHVMWVVAGSLFVLWLFWPNSSGGSRRG